MITLWISLTYTFPLIRLLLPDDGPMDPKPVEGCIWVINLLLSNKLITQ
jgi:hypothetical protein